MGAQKQTVQKIAIEDRPGALQELLSSIADSGANVVFMVAMAAGAGKGAAYVIADKPEAVKDAVKSTELKVEELTGFLLSGADRVGLGAEVTTPLSDAGINIVLSAATVAAGEFQLLILVDPEYIDAAAKALGA
jgi:hypothetical protein